MQNKNRTKVVSVKVPVPDYSYTLDMNRNAHSRFSYTCKNFKLVLNLYNILNDTSTIYAKRNYSFKHLKAVIPLLQLIQ